MNHLINVSVNEEELIIQSSGEIKFPHMCAKCGVPTHNQIRIQTGPGDKTSEAINFIAISIPKHVSIPCCPKCNQKNKSGNIVAISSIASAIILGFVYWKFQNDLSDTMTSIIWFLIVFLGMGWIVPVIKGQQSSMPAFVTYDSKGIYKYRFFSGALKDWATKQLGNEPAG